jgi:hypothetical protein
MSTAKLEKHRTAGLMPAQEDANVARHAAWKVDHLKMSLIAKRAQMFVPELVHILWNSGKSVLPTRLSLIDCAAPVGAKFIRKAKNLHLCLAILDCSVDNRRCALDLLFQGKAGGVLKRVEQSFFFRLGCGRRPPSLLSFFRLGFRHPQRCIRGRWQPFIDCSSHASTIRSLPDAATQPRFKAGAAVTFDMVHQSRRRWQLPAVSCRKLP